jgi:hypothetical protein
MGTDIHSFAERRTRRGWEACTDPTATVPDGTPALLGFYCGQDRNYALFAILAEVRRLTNSGFDAVRPPRGLPHDLSPIVRAIAEEHGRSGMCVHGHSWLTLRELLDFPWHDRKRLIEGYVDAQQYYLFRAEGRPLRMFPGPEEAGPACGGGVCEPLFGREQVVSNRKMDRHLRSGKGAPGVYTKIAFEVPYAEYCPTFVQETLPRLGTLGEPEDVRIVLWFDS